MSLVEFTTSFDLYDEVLFDREPYDMYAQMRRDCPVAHSDQHGGYWVLSRYADVYDGFRNHDALSSAFGTATPPTGSQRQIIPINYDPPAHGQYRGILNSAFSPLAIARLEPRIRHVASELIDDFIEDGDADLGAQFATPLPMIILCELLGVAVEDGDKFQAWVHTCIHESGRDQEAAKASAAEIYAYFEQRIAERQAAGERGDDLLGALMDASLDGRRLTDEELLDCCFLLLIAGIDTVTATLGNIFRYFVDHPETHELLARDPHRIPSAVEEFLRYLGPVQAMSRTAVKPLSVRGVDIAPGERVMLLMGSANRDEEQFTDPDQVVLDRPHNRHVAFGAGIHRCLGAHLARAELRIALEEILGRLGDLRLAPNRSPKRRVGNVWYVHSLPVSFQPGVRGQHR